MKKHRASRSGLTATATLLATLPLASAHAAPATAQTSFPTPHSSRPNILLIYTDDQGSIDLNCYGSHDLHTPNLDRLATQGTRFTQCYGAPMCSPSRASLMTGMFTLRAGLTSNASVRSGLPGERTTIAEMLKTAGYATAAIGKWHLGYTPDRVPNAQGFDYFFGHLGGCIDNYSHYYSFSGPCHHDLWQNQTEIWRNGQFFPQLIADEVKRFIQKTTAAPRPKPWFIYFAINVPHYPVQGTEKWLDYYKDKNLPDQRMKYAAFISTLDEIVGQLIDYLDQNGLRDNTIIIYQADNGHSTEARNGYGGGNAGPYRGAKGSLYEGGIRLPAMISWPARLPQNQTRDQLCGNVDWFPTIAALCGIDMKPYRDIDGKSLIPIINDPAAPTPHPVYHLDLGTRWLIRKGDWKLIYDDKNETDAKNQYTLTNLARDISEEKNFVKDAPQIVEELKLLRKAYVAEVSKTNAIPGGRSAEKKRFTGRKSKRGDNLDDD